VVEAAAAGDTTGKFLLEFAPCKGCQPMAGRLESLQDSIVSYHPVVSLRSTTGYGVAKPLAYSQATASNWWEMP